MERVVILGNGIAGVTAARHIRKLSDKHITIISGESVYFWSRTALMYIYMGHMTYENTKPYEDWFWKKNRINLVKDWVETINTTDQRCILTGGEPITYDHLIIATGSSTKYYDWPGQDSLGVAGMVSLQDLENIERFAPNNQVCRSAVLVGGGLIGVELAEMLHTREIETTVLVRDKAFWAGVLPKASAEMISSHVSSHGINLKHETELDEILSKNGKVIGVKTKDGEKIECDFVGICTGVKPNIEWLENTEIETDKGVLIDRYLQTNVKNIYAIGDCAEQRTSIDDRKPIEAVWYTGRMMGETVAQTICGNRMKYSPGVWFNSAKFFDIEFQTYGRVWPEPKVGHAHFHWQNTAGNKAMDIEYESEGGKIKGLNTFGIRIRHEILDLWIREGRSIEYVIENLKRANFDPEFYKTMLTEVRNKYSETSQNYG